MEFRSPFPFSQEPPLPIAHIYSQVNAVYALILFLEVPF